MENLKQFLLDKPEIKKEYDRVVDLAKDHKEEFNKKKEEYFEEHSNEYDIDTSEEPFRSILRGLSKELEEIGIKISSYDETRAVMEEEGYAILELIQKNESRATAWSSGNVGKKWRNTIVPLKLFPGPSGDTLPNYTPSKKIRTYEILEERGSRILISHKRFWPTELWVNFSDGELIEDEEKIKQLEELNELPDKPNLYDDGTKSIESLKEYLLENHVDNSGNLSLCGLDFSDFDGDIYMRDMKVKGKLIMQFFEVGGTLFQSEHKVGGDLNQHSHTVGGNVQQGHHVVGGYLNQSYQEVEGDFYNKGHKYGGKLTEEPSTKMLKKITVEELAELGYELVEED